MHANGWQPRSVAGMPAAWQPRSVAGMPAAVLAEIRCRTLRAVNARRTIIVSEGAGHGARPVIMLEADFVGQHIKPNVVAPRLDQARRDGQGGQTCDGW